MPFCHKFLFKYLLRYGHAVGICPLRPETKGKRTFKTFLADYLSKH